MCQPKSEGGQRCYSHAKEARAKAFAAAAKAQSELTRAANAQSRALWDGDTAEVQEQARAAVAAATQSSMGARERLEQADIDYASTPQGEADLERREESLLRRGNPTDDATAKEIRDLIGKGRARRARNQAVKAARKVAEVAEKNPPEQVLAGSQGTAGAARPDEPLPDLPDRRLHPGTPSPEAWEREDTP